MALARFAGRYCQDGTALLIDVGSTTCDVIPLLDGQPVAKGATDTERLLTGELVYTGVERSPVCAVAGLVPYRGQSCPIVHEVFATMRDVYLVLDKLPADPSNMHTPDGKPATKPAARTRLGRMIAADTQEFNHRDAVALAEARGQRADLAPGGRHWPGQGEPAATPGSDRFFRARRVFGAGCLGAFEIEVPTVSLAEELGVAISQRPGPRPGGSRS